MRWSSLAAVSMAALVAVAAVPAKKPKPVGRLLDIKHDEVYVGGAFVTDGRDLYANKDVETRRGGRALIGLTMKGTRCRIRNGTRIVVQPAPTVALRVTSATGEVWCATHVAKGSATFDGPGSRIQTRDPVFGIVVKRRMTVVKVRRGALALAGKRGTARAVVVTGGQQATVARGADPGQPAAISLSAAERAASAAAPAGLPPPKDTPPPRFELVETPPPRTEAT